MNRTLANEKPLNYIPPKGYLEKKIVKKITEKIIKDERILIDINDDIKLNELTINNKIVFAPPRLIPLLKLIIFPDYYVGDTYVKGDWYLKRGDVSSFLVNILANGAKSFKSYFYSISSIIGIRYLLKQIIFVKYFTRKVKKHYNIDADLYELFLDKDMLYTCAFFEDENDSLHEAQMRKIDLITERLKLSSQSSHILDIGCGWGGFTRRFVNVKPKGKITGISISKSQIEWATKHNREVLNNDQNSRIQYKLEDYLDHNPPENTDGYDGVVVVGMIEHVGKGHYNIFIDKIHDLLRSGGRALIHTIICPVSNRPVNKWIDMNIFPGAYVPSVADLASIFEKNKMLLENIYIHDETNYYKTIDCWKVNFLNNWKEKKEILKNRFSSEESAEIFFRTWDFYLNGTQIMFDNRFMNYQVAHFVIRKP